MQHTTQPIARKWVIASTVTVGAFVSVMNGSIIVIALPQMTSTFGASLDTMTWVAASYNIAEIILIAMTAWCSTLFGRKRFYLLSFGLFTAASVLCGMARSLEVMILARVLQGIGGGCLIPLAQAIMLEAFPDEERGMAMAFYTMGVVVAPMVGPVLGGWLTDQYGWPWIFFINVPVGILGIFSAIIVLADPPHMRRSLSQIDLVGVALLAVGLTALQLFLERGERENWFESFFIVVTGLIALISLTILVWRELRITDPVVNLRVLNNAPFLAGTCLGLIFGSTLFGSQLVLSLFLQQSRGYSVLDSALIQLPRVLIVLVMAPIAGRLYNRVDSRLLVGGCMLLILAGYMDMASYNLNVGGSHIAPAMLMTGAGMGFMFSVMTAASMRTIPPPLLTAASGLLALARRIGANIGYALTVSQVNQRAAFHRARLADHLTPYNAETTQALDHWSGRLSDVGLSGGAEVDGALKFLDGTVNRHATMMAYNDAFWIMGMLFALGMPFLFLLGKYARRSGAES